MNFKQWFATLDGCYDSYEDLLRECWEAALAQQVPVAWVDPVTLSNLLAGVEDVHLVHEVEVVNSVPLYAAVKEEFPK